MLAQAFYAGLTVYLALLAQIVYQAYFPTECRGNHCIFPMFSPAELASSDLYFFVTDSPDAPHFGSLENGVPPYKLAAQAHTLFVAAQAEPSTPSTVAALDDTNATRQLSVQESGLRFVTWAPSVDTGGVWEQSLRVPVLASTRRNTTLYAAFFVVPGGRPLDPAAYPFAGADGSVREFEESVLFAVCPLTRFAPVRRSSASMLLAEKPSIFAASASASATEQHSPPPPPPPPKADLKADRRAKSHWRFSYHPLRLRMVAPAQPLAAPFLPPDGLRLLLHQASPGFFAPDDAPISAGAAAGATGAAAVLKARRALPRLLFRPWLFVDDWTVLARQTVELSQSPGHPDPPAKLQLKGCSLGRFRVFEALKAAFRLFTEAGAVHEDDVDEIKR